MIYLWYIMIKGGFSELKKFEGCWWLGYFFLTVALQNDLIQVVRVPIFHWVHSHYFAPQLFMFSE